ncbi:MAG: alpha/beta hydrolase [Sphingomonadaceae bacterium]|nr:alpha/beta hydrolase [Sphingomonadaceae bacterium]
MLEGAALWARVYKSFGRLGARGPADGPKLMVIPGFLANDRTTLGLQRALAEAGWRVTGWGLGMNKGATPDKLEQLAAQIEAFGGGDKVILVGWSLGGIFAREVAKLRPELVEKVVTMGSPFSGDPRGNNVWRLYELIAGHPVDDPPIEANLAEKPPVPTLALWSRRDGIVSAACTRGQPHESDRQLEVDSSHMGFAVSGHSYPQIIAALRSF